jgi:hypothetical protein
MLERKMELRRRKKLKDGTRFAEVEEIEEYVGYKLAWHSPEDYQC